MQCRAVTRISTKRINWLCFFLRLRKREKVKMKLNVNMTSSTEWKLQTRESHDGAYNTIPRRMGAMTMGERETWKIGNSARRSTWIAFTSVNCAGKSNGNLGETKREIIVDGCLCCSRFLHDFFRVTKERGNTGRVCVSLLGWKRFFWSNRHNLTRQFKR